MVAIPDSAIVFWLSIAAFFYTLENPSVAYVLLAFYIFFKVKLVSSTSANSKSCKTIYFILHVSCD